SARGLVQGERVEPAGDGRSLGSARNPSVTAFRNAVPPEPFDELRMNGARGESEPPAPNARSMRLHAFDPRRPPSTEDPLRGPSAHQGERVSGRWQLCLG